MRQRVSDEVHTSTTDSILVFAGPCVLERMTVNTDASGTIVIYNNTTDAAPTIASHANPGVGTYEYGCFCSTGVTVATSASFDLTFVVTQFASAGQLGPGILSSGSNILLEDGDDLLTEADDHILLES